MTLETGFMMRDSDYLLGHSPDELHRLVEQSRFIGDLTEHIWALAGLQPGMTVLDAGCGAGDTSVLAAKLVGPAGRVIGIDRSLDAIALARQRAEAAGLSNVEFIQTELVSVTLSDPVDAVVGRLVLMYSAEPAKVVRHLMTQLKSGGIIVFQELDISAAKSVPRVETFEEVGSWIKETFRRGGADACAGLGLGATLREAGVLSAKMLQMARVESGPDSPTYAFMEQLTRTLLPAMVKSGVATEEQVQIDSLAIRLREETCRRNAVLVPLVLVGGWGRKE